MIDDRLTSDIEAQAKCKPRFSTQIVTTDGGHEVRNSLWRYPRHVFEFNLAPDDPTSDYFTEFRDLYYAAGGAAEAFLFKHWSDFIGENEALASVDGSALIFQLMRNYTRGLITRTRKLTRPVAGSVVVYVGGVEQMSGFAVDYETGQVTFDSPPAQVPTADFEFDVPVRFMDDEIELVGISDALEQPIDISLIEVRE